MDGHEFVDGKALVTEGAARSVLLVDDEDDIRIVASTALRRLAGWEVVTAASGAEAVVRACTRDFDAVVLDVMMPGLAGPATLVKLQSEPERLLTSACRTSAPPPSSRSSSSNRRRPHCWIRCVPT